MSRFHESKKRRNPRLAEGSGGAEKRGQRVDLGNLSPSSSKAKQRETGKKAWQPSAVGKASGSARKRHQIDKWIVTRNSYPLQQINSAKKHRTRKKREAKCRFGLAATATWQATAFFSCFDGETKKKSAQCPASAPSSCLFSKGPQARDEIVSTLEVPMPKRTKQKKPLPVETAWLLAVAPTARQSTRHGACPPLALSRIEGSTGAPCRGRALSPSLGCPAERGNALSGA